MKIRIKEVKMDDACKCVECGCTGNEDCGAFHLDIDRLCTLDACLICPCCRKVGKVENMKRWKRV